jgi:D-alanyl-D-alanine carboxypeptidase (penicillin-binding protein 5/6)
VIFLGWCVQAHGLDISLTAQSAILMDAGTGDILYAKNSLETRPPASTTKMMTALLALERGMLEQPVRISARAASVGEASVGLKAYDVLTLEELLHGALIGSGNDASVAAAEATAPSEEEFVSMMNLKAKCLGALRTRFVNTNGLPDAGHMTSAYDLALIARAALRHPVFASIVRQRNHRLVWTYPEKTAEITNTNRLLWADDRITGVKTGTTDLAGKCLVASMTDHGQTWIAVVLNAADRYGDVMALFRSGTQDGLKTVNVAKIPDEIGEDIYD